MDSVIVILFVAVILVGIGLLVFMAITRKTSKAFDVAKYQQDWLEIEESVTADPQKQQFAILQADKLLDRALKEKGLSGSTMAERMASGSRLFTKREAIWTAHKLRNKIAHDHDVKITPVLTKKALATYKKALRDLGAL